jgi:hypothetical protein
MFGSGVSPGFAELLAIVSAMVCNRIDKVTVNEAADTTFYDSPETEKPVGFGQPIDHPELQAMAAKGTAIFGEAVHLVGDALGVELDDVRCEPSSPKPQPISRWRRGPSAPDASPASTSAGRESSTARP